MPYVGGDRYQWELVVIDKPGTRIKTSLYIEAGKHEQLQRLSEHTRVSQADYLREALDDLLQKYKATLQEISKKRK